MEILHSLLFVSTHLCLVQLGLFYHCSQTPRTMHPSWIWPCFWCLILASRAAGQHRISSHLPCSGIDFQSSLNYFGSRSFTQVLDHRSLWPCLFFFSFSLAPHSVVNLGLFRHAYRFRIYFWLVFLSHTWACVWERNRQRGNEYT